MKNIVEDILTELKHRLSCTVEQCLTEQGFPLRLAAFRIAQGWTQDSQGNPVPPPKKKPIKNAKRTRGVGTAGFEHAEQVSSRLGTAVLQAQIRSGQELSGDWKGKRQITIDTPTAEDQKQLDFGVHGARKKLVLDADAGDRRSDQDTTRYGYTTSIASANGDDGVIKTHIWDDGSKSWKEMSHGLEYAQGTKQWIRRNVTLGGKPKPQTEAQKTKEDALKAVVGLGKTATWKAIRDVWGPDTTAKVASPDTHLVHFDGKGFSVVRIGDLHDATPIDIKTTNRKAEVNKEGKIIRNASTDVSLDLHIPTVMAHQRSKQIGRHDLTADQVLEYFGELHRTKLQQDKQQPIKEWVCSRLRDRGISIQG